MHVQSVSLYNNRTQNTKNVHFGAVALKGDEIITTRTRKWIRALNNHIDNIWKNTRKENLQKKNPEFILFDDEDGVVTLKAIYGMQSPAILLETEKNNRIEQIIFNRIHPERFRYEKSVKTPHGSISVKTHNSANSRDRELEATVNAKINKYVSQIVPKETAAEYFGIENPRSLKKVMI